MTALPDIPGHKPHVKTDTDGNVLRVGWPTVVTYKPTEGPDAGKELPWPPTARTHPGTPEPVPLSSAETARKLTTGELRPLPRSVPYLTVEHDIAAYEKLRAMGWITDPLHAGCAPGELIDNRNVKM